MDRDFTKLFFLLLRSALCDNKLSEEEKTAISREQIEKLLALSEKHDVSHLIVWAFKKNGLLTNEDGAKEKPLLKAIYRCEKQEYALDELSAVLEKEKIPYIPLKGSVLRNYYPEAWMRTSCDIDVLVKGENLERAVSALTEQLQYTNKGKGSHDVQMFSPSGVHVELHYDLIEDGRASNSVSVLNTVWEKATPCKENGYRCELSDGMFYFYHIAHMAKHFENGGCGLRPIIDLWILDSMESADTQERETLLEKGGLLKFARAAQKLSRAWFENKEEDEVTQNMETYILFGGVYGNSANRISVKNSRRGGKIRYAISRIFLPYATLKHIYPVLRSHKWLYPLMQVRRLCRLLFCGGIKRGVNELQMNARITSEQSKNIQSFLSEIGL